MDQQLTKALEDLRRQWLQVDMQEGQRTGLIERLDRLSLLLAYQGFDLEVLDRDGLGLAGLPAPLDYLNVRILQCHDVWHEMAGYATTGLHEVCISGFQMGQFGHHYSSTFLAMLLTKAACTEPAAVGPILDPILCAYAHGRETPPLLGASNYWFRASNSAGVVQSGTRITVTGKLAAPSFTLQPVAQTVATGASVTFSALATGTAPIT